ncbi:MAG: hypothetical protein H0T54_09815 [Geodermatophilaceae bacterium]|nr:hypothetical protein [Geodermatophilaceae bacterium]
MIEVKDPEKFLDALIEALADSLCGEELMPCQFHRNLAARLAPRIVKLLTVAADAA